MATKRNAELIVKYTTVYPFRIPQYCMVCVYCCESYVTSSEYRKHMEKEHRTFKIRMAFLHCHEGFLKVDCSKIRCRICNGDYKTEINAVASHLYYDHKINLDLDYELGLQPFILEDKAFSCAICQKKTYNLRQLSRHTQSHFLKYTCESCGKSYATNTSLRNHMKYGHIETDKLMCRKCKIYFNSPEERRQHLVDSSKCWSYLCNICGERCMTWEIKRAHLADTHQIVEKPLKCPECDAVFAARKAFNTHFRIEHTDDNYICTYCGMKFASKQGMEEHKTIHTKEKRYECTVCSKLFPRKKNLVQHMWIHSEHKRFECTLCDRQFSQRVSWKGHMQSQHPDLLIY